MELKPTWAAMVPLKSGESLKQIKRFFNCLARLISMHVRRLLHEWLDEWLSVIQIYRVSIMFYSCVRKSPLVVILMLV